MGTCGDLWDDRAGEGLARAGKGRGGLGDAQAGIFGVGRSVKGAVAVYLGAGAKVRGEGRSQEHLRCGPSWGPFGVGLLMFEGVLSRSGEEVSFSRMVVRGRQRWVGRLQELESHCPVPGEFRFVGSPPLRRVLREILSRGGRRVWWGNGKGQGGLEAADGQGSGSATGTRTR